MLLSHNGYVGNESAARIGIDGHLGPSRLRQRDGGGIAGALHHFRR